MVSGDCNNYQEHVSDSVSIKWFRAHLISYCTWRKSSYSHTSFNWLEIWNFCNSGTDL